MTSDKGLHTFLVGGQNDQESSVTLKQQHISIHIAFSIDCITKLFASNIARTNEGIALTNGSVYICAHIIKSRNGQTASISCIFQHSSPIICTPCCLSHVQSELHFTKQTAIMYLVHFLKQWGWLVIHCTCVFHYAGSLPEQSHQDQRGAGAGGGAGVHAHIGTYLNDFYFLI